MINATSVIGSPWAPGVISANGGNGKGDGGGGGGGRIALWVSGGVSDGVVVSAYGGRPDPAAALTATERAQSTGSAGTVFFWDALHLFPVVYVDGGNTSSLAETVLPTARIAPLRPAIVVRGKAMVMPDGMARA